VIGAVGGTAPAPAGPSPASAWCIHSPGPKLGGAAPWNAAAFKGIPGEPDGGPPPKPEKPGLDIEGSEGGDAAGRAPGAGVETWGLALGGATYEPGPGGGICGWGPALGGATYEPGPGGGICGWGPALGGPTYAPGTGAGLAGAPGGPAGGGAPGGESPGGAVTYPAGRVIGPGADGFAAWGIPALVVVADARPGAAGFAAAGSAPPAPPLGEPDAAGFTPDTAPPEPPPGKPDTAGLTPAGAPPPGKPDTAGLTPAGAPPPGKLDTAGLTPAGAPPPDGSWLPTIPCTVDSNAFGSRDRNS
jgi:hypothetical protein